MTNTEYQRLTHLLRYRDTADIIVQFRGAPDKEVQEIVKDRLPGVYDIFLPDGDCQIERTGANLPKYLCIAVENVNSERFSVGIYDTLSEVEEALVNGINEEYPWAPWLVIDLDTGEEVPFSLHVAFELREPFCGERP